MPDKLPEYIDIPSFCPGCSSTVPIRVRSAAFIRWQDGATATEAFPDLSPNDRERLITGLCPSCFKEWTQEPPE